MAQVDRRVGVVDDLGIKRPVRCASTSNVTLSGLQTIDGIALNDGDRVLLTGQSTASQNGIWVASTGNWTRPKDFDGALDCVRGTLVFVQVGSVNARSLWQVDTPDPITIDLTPLSFVELVLATGNSTWSNTRLAKTANYTVTNADKGATLALGGSAFFTVTLNAASGYDANFAITIVNEDAGRGKRISPNGLTSFIVWPKQTVRVYNQNNVWQTDPPAPTRWIIPGAVTFQVNPTLGSDTNDGLGSGPDAFATIQKAVDVAQYDADCNGSGVVIQLADGTYTSGALIVSPIIGTTTIAITGNAVTPGNVIVDVGPGETCFDVQDHSGLSLSNMRLIGGALCVRSRQYAIVDLAGIEFGACTGTHIAAVDNSIVSTSGAMAIVGDAAVHVSAQANAIVNYNGTVTIASARAFSVFASAADHGVINGAATFTGGGVAGTTGIRFISTDSHIEQAITWPGNTAGTATWKADADGVAATPFWTWNSDTDTGIYRIGANNIGVAAGGVKALDIAAAGVDVLGTNTNDTAAAGFVGEYVESAVQGGSAVALTSGVTTNVTSISLTAGDWDVFGTLAFAAAATTNITSLTGAVSTTSATMPAGIQGRTNIAVFPNAGNTVAGNPSGFFHNRFSLNATTTVYLVASATFTVSTLSAFGFIAARRVR